jgi:chromatin segregation and condensation protein Rec8/ScpA/Scc1 (kleisin family)
MLEELLRLVDLVKDRRKDPTEILVADFATKLADVEDPVQLSRCLVATSWLLASKVAALTASEDVDDSLEIDAETESALIRLYERSMFAAVANELAARAGDVPFRSPAAVKVDVDPVSCEPIDINELIIAVKAALARVGESSGEELIVAGSVVDLAVVTDCICGTLAQLGSTRFSQVSTGFSPGEVVAAFVVLLEAQAFGAVVLEQAGSDIDVLLADMERLRLVWEMARVLH